MAFIEEPVGSPPVWADIAGVMIFKVPVGETYTLSEITISNTDTTERLIALHHVIDGDDPEDENMFVPNIPIKSPMMIEGARGKVFNAEDELWAICDEDDVVNVSCSYVRRYEP